MGEWEREGSGLPALTITLTKIVMTTSSAKLALAFGTVAASHRAVADYLISPCLTKIVATFHSAEFTPQYNHRRIAQGHLWPAATPVIHRR